MTEYMYTWVTEQNFQDWAFYTAAESDLSAMWSSNAED